MSQLYAPATLTPGKEPHTHWIGGWVGPGAGLDIVAKRKILQDLNMDYSACSIVTILTELSQLCGNGEHYTRNFKIMLLTRAVE
jgi:hypothetical protein